MSSLPAPGFLKHLVATSLDDSEIEVHKENLTTNHDDGGFEYIHLVTLETRSEYENRTRWGSFKNWLRSKF